ERALVGSDRVDGKQIETEPGDCRLDPDFPRMKLVFELAAVEHQLQGANPQAQGQEPEEIEWFAMQVAGLADKDQNAQRTDDADRQVDVEDPAPAVVISQPTAERRPHDWPENCPSHPLQRTKENEFREARGSATQRGSERETDDRGQEDIFDN